MKISFTSLTFKTLSLLFMSSIIFIIFIVVIAKESFFQGYTYLIKEDLSSIEEKISPDIAMNLSYGLTSDLKRIATAQLKHKKILLLKIDSVTLEKPMLFSKKNKSIQELKDEGHFVSTKVIYDPATKNELGKTTIIYSNESYKTYMQNFYKWFIGGVSIFGLAIALLGFLLYNSLKRLSVLASSFERFNPNRPKDFHFNVQTNDEIGTINRSANIMVQKLTKYIDNTQKLNDTILQKEAHLKEAQRIAKVGSWEYNVIDGSLLLSDEVYRILGVKFGTAITWKDFLDFISKDDYDNVVKVIEDAIKHGSKFNIKYALILKSKNEIYVQTRGKVRKKAGGMVRITAVSMDITNDIKNKKTIEKLAYYDSLTGLANRTLLKDRMHKAIQYAKREQTNLAVMFLDLDHFKLINDTLGHSVGDDMLIHIAEILKIHIRESDTLSRLGGDEFVILLPSVKSIFDAQNIASKIQHTLQSKHDIGDHQLYITSSIGVSLYPDHGDNSEELIRNADTAMYEAKNSGRNNYRIYSQSMGNYVDQQLHLEQDLIQAVKHKAGIEVFYQAKIDSENNFISGAEALARWRHPTNGLIFPDQFIHIAESTGLMIELGNIIIEESIFQLQEWNKLGLVGLKIAINLSARQFQDPNLVSFISSMLHNYQVSPSQVEFEITETLSMTNMTNTLRILTELKAIGVSIAIDDFGTGHSSLAYLKKFPINTLKIDRSFVLDIIEDDDDKTIVQTIVSMAHSLGFNTVAEGVETLEHVALLKTMGCDQLQGYYFSKPIPKDEFTKFIQDYMPNK
ncbi:diguanylate cyclase/phosphodiesterase (GGDEF & EAL & HAMP linker domain) with PAS/PAC sensor(s) [Sulfurimonas gotlandica GD1]|uniref:Diguanylate cyclase/phosphodiesterase (GGDEF & EAL & HAMP linker domain) with PAS/PAC sensor(S) n=1 Tax=Sulfurimonas gotlandica (strain DSM 19862 / JCM 16533 / GD1) TaxID=929558 RepID=B6BIT7_SULGG|nr:GGDEF domain-containing phosphodiesterase [Sulfurimonas gotlandica]EDZ63568.1 diguanylate cyclase/phosphodiesterase with PAS/PAC and GAF sensor [Sulfurimonas gotlandica GD1]EHP30447.1 diguanylate cyclase/phosphodiesterase (GGDEF & EAL & HAMP linker domain) with PAS/PAC sensor(s) [Sulfurimonas gotlandica GD1]